MANIGISTASFFDRVMLEDAPQLLCQWGVTEAEYFLNCRGEYAPAFLDLLVKRTQDNGIRVTSVHPMSLMFEPQLFSPHPRQFQEACAEYEQVLAAGERLGADHYVMHGAPTLAGVTKNLQIERLAKVFDLLCDRAADHGLQLTLENVSWCIFQTPSFAAALEQQMQRDTLRYTLDVKQAIRAGQDPLAFAKALGKKILAVHAVDCDMHGAKPRFCLPPQGGYDFHTLLQALTENGFDGVVLLEAYSDMYQTLDELKNAFEALKNSCNK